MALISLAPRDNRTRCQCNRSSGSGLRKNAGENCAECTVKGDSIGGVKCRTRAACGSYRIQDSGGSAIRQCKPNNIAFHRSGGRIEIARCGGGV